MPLFQRKRANHGVVASGRGGARGNTRTLTAAATVIRPEDEDERNRVRRGPMAWQREAARTYDDLVEIHYAGNYIGNAMGKLAIGAAVRPDPRQPPVMLDPDGNDDYDSDVVTDEERIVLNAVVDRLHENSAVPMHEMQRHFGLNIFTCGDVNLLGFTNDDGQEVWESCSVEELVVNPNGNGYARRMSYEGGPLHVVPLPEDAYIARIYQRHWRYSSWADSSMRPVLNLCQSLRNLTDAIEAASQSRLSAKIVLLPHGFLAANPDITATGQEDEEQQNPTITKFIDHFETPPQQPRSAARWVPFLAFAEREDVSAAKVLDPMRDIDKEASAQRLELRKEIAVGLDLPPDVLSGAADVNHWSLFQIGEDTWKYHLEQFAQVMANGLTIGFLRPQLHGLVAPDRIGKFFVWYDPTDLLVHPDREKQYQDAYDRIEVSGAAYRASKGIAEAEAPTDDERANRIYEEIFKRFRAAPGPMPTPEEIKTANFPEQELIGNQDLLRAEGEPRGPAALPPPPQPQGQLPAAQRQPPPAAPPATNPQPAAPATSPPGVAVTRARTLVGGGAPALPSVARLSVESGKGPLGRQMATAEAQIRGRLIELVDAASRRALEKAGNRLRSLANRDAGCRALVAETPPEMAAAVLGRENVERLATSAQDLLAGTLGTDALRTRWNSLVAKAQAQAYAAVDDLGPDDPDPERWDELAQTRSSHAAEGFAVLTAGLLGYLAGRIYDPGAPPPDQGEFDTGTVVPPGLVRDALDAAGGGPDPDGTSGLLSGQDMTAALDANGLEVRILRWTVGDPDRPFPDHHDLEGEEFPADGWQDDARLAVTGTFPESDYLEPGDHDGCLCDWEEDIVPAGEAPDVLDTGLNQLATEAP